MKLVVECLLPLAAVTIGATGAVAAGVDGFENAFSCRPWGSRQGATVEIHLGRLQTAHERWLRIDDSDDLRRSPGTLLVRVRCEATEAVYVCTWGAGKALRIDRAVINTTSTFELHDGWLSNPPQFGARSVRCAVPKSG